MKEGSLKLPSFYMIIEIRSPSLSLANGKSGYKSRLVHALTRPRRYNLDPRTFEVCA